MPLNSLLGQAGLKLGPLLLETLVKHYIERIADERGDGVTDLSRDELLYDQAFHVVKVRKLLLCALRRKTERIGAQTLQTFLLTATK